MSQAVYRKSSVYRFSGLHLFIGLSGCQFRIIGCLSIYRAAFSFIGLSGCPGLSVYRAIGDRFIGLSGMVYRFIGCWLADCRLSAYRFIGLLGFLGLSAYRAFLGFCLQVVYGIPSVSRFRGAGVVVCFVRALHSGSWMGSICEAEASLLRSGVDGGVYPVGTVPRTSIWVWGLLHAGLSS